MQMIKPLLLGGLMSTLIILHTAPVWGWNVNLTPDNQVVVSNATPMPTPHDIYLVWYHPDADDANQQYRSWTGAAGWQSASETPVPIRNQAFSLDRLAPTELTELPATCEPDQRCFLVLVAVEPDKDPLIVNNWQRSALLPLSVAASYERMPGQAFFLSKVDQVDDEDGFSELIPEPSIAPTDAAGAPPSTDLAVADEAVQTEDGRDNDASGNSAETEKPDIFKLVGDQLLYANGAAEKFQVIDVSDVTQPRLVGETRMSGTPRELYMINGYYVLMQISADRASLITVIERNAADNMQVVSEIELPGYFMESRRRNDVIYAVTEGATFTSFEEGDCAFREGCGSWQGMTVTALQVNSSGQLTEMTREELSGYGARLAIFSDYLLMASSSPQQWNFTDIQVFDLSSPNSPLVKLPTLTVPGRVPSEFHMHMRNDLLHVAYGPENRNDGSTLAIFQLSAETAELQGQVDNIAPGEDLYATRFAGDKAYMVTYERVDPLWVIDISNPAAPTILGELKVPGWSELMFFNNDQLFAVGVHDQPEANEPADFRVSRAAMSLFDVSDPTQPDILDRFVPLAGQTRWTYSPALSDERALLLNWQSRYAALPVNAWEIGSGMHLQIVTFENDRFSDAGLVESPVNLQRSLSIADNVLAGLGDQALITLQWGDGQAEVLAELELAANISWLHYQNGFLWAGGRGNDGLYRFYQYDPNALETPQATWNLSKSFDTAIMNADSAVFYDYNPLSVQMLDLNTGVLSGVINLEVPVEQIEATRPSGGAAPSDAILASLPIWYGRSEALVNDNWFYVAEQRPMEPVAKTGTDLQAMPFVLPEAYYYRQTQWVLRGWDLSTQGVETAKYSIPGTPVGFTAQGDLIVRENDGGQTRMNLVNLANGTANLLSTQQYPCDYHQTEVQWAEALYLHCYPVQTQLPVIEPPLLVEPQPLPVAEQTLRDALEGGRAPMPDLTQTQQPYTLKIAVGQSFVQKGAWEWAQQQRLIDASNDTVAMQPDYYYYWDDMPVVDMAVDDVSILPVSEAQCGIYGLQADNPPTLLTALDMCPWGEGFAMGEQQAWWAKGFAGIEVVRW